MEGIVLQGVDRNKFLELYNKVDELTDHVKKLVDEKSSENISPDEAAELIGVTTQTIHVYIKKGILPASKIGRRIVIKRSDVENSLKEVKSLKYKR